MANQLEQKLIVSNRYGIHARSAAKIAMTCSKFASDIEFKVSKSNAIANGKSIMALLVLGATQNTELTLKCSGRDASAAAAEIAELFANHFGEEQ